jgi:hypothetical protein
MSRKAAPSEDELLQRRLSHAKWLSGMLADPNSLASLTVSTYAGVVGVDRENACVLACSLGFVLLDSQTQ